MKFLTVASFILAMLAIILPYLERALKAFIIKNGANRFLSRLLYFFSRSKGDFDVSNQRVYYTYETLGCHTNTINYKVELDCEALKDGLTSHLCTFSWNGDNAKYDIFVNESLRINNINQTQEKTSFHYPLETKNKHDKFTMKYCIKNLQDNQLQATYLSKTIREKTRCLTLNVIDKTNSIKNMKFMILKDGEIISFYDNNKKVSEIPLSYNEDIKGYQYVITYPRKGYKYLLDWEI